MIASFLRLLGRKAPQQAEEPDEVCYTAEDVIALAELLWQERLRLVQHGNQPRKFRNLVLMDFPQNKCYAQHEVNGVKRRVQVPCPWQQPAFASGPTIMPRGIGDECDE